MFNFSLLIIIFFINVSNISLARTVFATKSIRIGNITYPRGTLFRYSEVGKPEYPYFFKLDKDSIEFKSIHFSEGFLCKDGSFSKGVIAEDTTFKGISLKAKCKVNLPFNNCPAKEQFSVCNCGLLSIGNETWDSTRNPNYIDLSKRCVYFDRDMNVLSGVLKETKSKQLKKFENRFVILDQIEVLKESELIEIPMKSVLVTYSLGTTYDHFQITLLDNIRIRNIEWLKGTIIDFNKKGNIVQVISVPSQSYKGKKYINGFVLNRQYSSKTIKETILEYKKR